MTTEQAAQSRIVVHFVGAGPGRPDLLTLRAVTCLREADVIVHDLLVPPAILRYASPTAKLIPVPRSPPHAALEDPGRATGRLLVELAAAGDNVVRLKGGDPTVFGRLVEECEPLRESGFAVEIVPGVTAALAAAAAAGIPLTSRADASMVSLVTGHEAESKVDPVDHAAWSGAGTIVIYMGVGQSPAWSEALLAAGRPADTPVTIVCRCGWPDERIAHTTLAACAGELLEHRHPPPAVVIIGNTGRIPVASPPDGPLAGKRILVTRPAGQGEPLERAIANNGGSCLHVPVIEILPPSTWEPLDSAIRRADTFDWLVFVSTNGVASFASRLATLGLDARCLGSARVAAIGESTRGALQRHGLPCDLIPDSADSEGVVAALGDHAGSGRFLVIRASRGRDVIRVGLEAASHEVEEVIAYTSSSVSALTADQIRQLDRFPVDWITVTSPAIAEAAARLFADRIGEWRIASISPVTSAALAGHNLRPTVEAERADIESLVQALVAWEQHRS
jgi:uroporphyrinogen III methyltransferase/synthase